MALFTAIGHHAEPEAETSEIRRGEKIVPAREAVRTARRC